MKKTSSTWGYEGAQGPEHWGNLCPEFAPCKDGKCQAPIDITGTVKAEPGNIVFDYRPTPLKVIDNGHSIQVNYGEGSFFRAGGKVFKLLQFHFHSPSENTVNGKTFDMEMHLVHQSSQGELAVVGVFYNIGKQHPTMQTIWDNIPAETGREKTIPSIKVNAVDLLPANGSYFYFDGSLTTPPCTEGVRWYVLKNAPDVSKAQVEKFLAVIGANARPVHPLYGRTVYGVNTGDIVIKGG